MKKCTVVVFLFSVMLVNAQSYVNYNPSGGTSGVATMTSSVNSDNNVAGSIYLFDDWIHSAKIYTDANTIISVENINFNARDATFSSRMSEDSIFVFGDIYKVEVAGKHFEKVNDHFYEVLYTFNDNQMFLKKHIVTVKPDLHLITSTVIGPGKYVMKDEFYIYNNNELEKFWPSKKNVLKLLKSEETLISKQAKSHKLSFSNEMDLVEIFRYYDTL